MLPTIIILSTLYVPVLQYSSRIYISEMCWNHLLICFIIVLIIVSTDYLINPQGWTSCTVLTLTPHWSTLGGTRSCAAPLALASCCVGCWGDGCAAPDVSVAWPDWRLQRNVQTLDRSQLWIGRIDTTLSFWNPQLFSFTPWSSIHLARLSTIAEKSQWL